MNKHQAIELLRGGPTGITEWNRCRETELGSIDLMRLDLSWAKLKSANLRYVNLALSKLLQSDLEDSDLTNADLSEADLRGANLRGANLSNANLSGTDLTHVTLQNANFENAICSYTVFCLDDLSSARGLDTIRHEAPSSMDMYTLFLSKGNIPDEFLRGCGTPKLLVDYLPSIFRSSEPVQFFSCFISYSHKDERFARKLHSRLQNKGLQVWCAAKDVRGGQKLVDQIDQAILQHDKVLLVLSHDSMNSEWVRTELFKAHQREVQENRRVLFPVRLIEYDAIRKWECFDADSGKDLAREVREYFISDFSNWDDEAKFAGAFERLLGDLASVGQPRVTNGPAAN